MPQCLKITKKFLITWSLQSNRSLLQGQKLVGNAKMSRLKCDILSNFPTMSGYSTSIQFNWYSSPTFLYSSCRLEYRPLYFSFQPPFLPKRDLTWQPNHFSDPLFWLLASLTVKHFSCKWEMGWCGTTAYTTVSQRPRPPSKAVFLCAAKLFIALYSSRERPSRDPGACSLPKIRVFVRRPERATHWAVFSLGSNVSNTASLEMSSKNLKFYEKECLDLR